MIIEGLRLPEAFVQAVRQGKLKREIGSWPLKEDVDAYGNPLETELGYVYEDEMTIAQETAELPQHFQPDGCYGTDECANEPGFVRDITDFSNIVCFGIAGDGAPFCFDFREDRHEPSIIWWDDVYWRRIAPNFEAFLNLFDFGNTLA